MGLKRVPSGKFTTNQHLLSLGMIVFNLLRKSEQQPLYTEPQVQKQTPASATVNSYVRTFSEHQLSYQGLNEFSDSELAELFPKPDYKDINRYEQLASCFPRFKQLRKTGCMLQTLWKQYLDDHPDGYSYTHFVAYYRQRSGKTRGIGILDHKVEQKLFIDFADKTFLYTNRQTEEVRQAQIFVAILPACTPISTLSIANGVKNLCDASPIVCSGWEG